MVTTKNYNDALTYENVGRHSGSDTVFLGLGSPSLKTAVDRAIEAGNGVYLSNAVIETTRGLFRSGYRVTGDVYAVVGTSSNTLSPDETYRVAQNGSVVTLTNGTESVEIAAMGSDAR